MFDCILLMAGSGVRSHLPYNKILHPIQGKPIYEYSLNLFLSMNECRSVIVVIKKEDEALYHFPATPKLKLTYGGATRTESVLHGLKEAKEEKVLIHDAARPNIQKEQVEEVYKALDSYPCSVLATPVVDCIKEGKNGFVTKTLDRNQLWSVQTPQGVLKDLLLKGLEESSMSYYDDVEVLEKMFHMNAKIIVGNPNNIKVTTFQDIQYMTYLLGGNHE